MVAGSALASLLIDGSTKIILQEALSVIVEEVAGEAFVAITVRAKLLTVSITVRCLLAKSVTLVELVALIAACAVTV